MMACIDKMSKVNDESEMEEGEIVDELDDLSDISSEEEFLLRQRLEVLENYNNVLERKKAKRFSTGPGTKQKRDVLCDLSEVSAAELEDSHNHIYKHVIVHRHVKPHSKQKKRKDQQFVDENVARRKRDSQKKKTSRSKKKLGVKVLNESSSDDSEDEYRNKRKKLAEAVIVHRGADKSSLSARLFKMIHGSESHITEERNNTDTILPKSHITIIDEILSPISSVNADDPMNLDELRPNTVQKEKDKNICEPIELSTDDDVRIISDIENKDEVVEKQLENVEQHQLQVEKDSDEDLELLRQHALKSKPTVSKSIEPDKTDQKPLSEDEDSDTTELRLICLKSALLKKAIEMKQKQKLQKKLSQSSNLEDDLLKETEFFTNNEEDNNTDIESVDMDMGSDTEEKLKEINENENKNSSIIHKRDESNALISAINNLNSAAKEDELDDDEDLLRAKLLTSLSKNLTNLVSPDVLNKMHEGKKVDDSSSQTIAKTANAPEAKKFIIKLDESDSEGEHEATKNLTKMHIKLSEQIDFQQKLDMFLKSTRMEVENAKLPDVVQKSPVPKKPMKYVAKAVNNLPKSEQIEYKNLVKRMAELEKMKQTRQATLSVLNQQQYGKETLKPRNVTIDTQAKININLEEQIAKSRKTIAEESAKMLKLKEEATKLSQRYKIAATELRNITTAITLNKKQQKSIQISLSKIRLQHQTLLKSSTTSLHSNVNGRIPHLSNLGNKALSNKLQKENNPKDEFKNPLIQKAVKISVVNDFVEETAVNNLKLSVELDVTNNKKVVKIPINSDAESNRTLEVNNDILKNEQRLEEQNRRLSGNDIETFSIRKESESAKSTELVAVCDLENKRYISVDDYKSPLDAFGSTTWQADPNAIFCPFEVGGQCKDPDCKYFHTPTPKQ